MEGRVSITSSTERSPKRILIACIGNIFLGDDGFGVEVAQRLMSKRYPEGVQVIDVAQLLVQATRPVKTGVAADGPSEGPGLTDADPGAGSQGTPSADPDVMGEPEADPTGEGGRP